MYNTINFWEDLNRSKRYEEKLAEHIRQHGHIAEVMDNEHPAYDISYTATTSANKTHIATIEVKVVFTANPTHIPIEKDRWCLKTYRNQPTGYSLSKAKYYAFCIPASNTQTKDIYYIIKKSKLDEMFQNNEWSYFNQDASGFFLYYFTLDSIINAATKTITI
jgi:hypothetical protein